MKIDLGMVESYNAVGESYACLISFCASSVMYDILYDKFLNPKTGESHSGKIKYYCMRMINCLLFKELYSSIEIYNLLSEKVVQLCIRG